jgi:uncharacterized protein (TIGR04255 family)
MPGTADHPFSGPPVDTILLHPPPLDRVLAQVRFSPVLAVAEQALASRVQQELGDEYPIASHDVEFSVAMQPLTEAPPAFDQVRLWRFQPPDETWRVTLSTGFVALETTAYEGHQEFFDRFGRLLDITARIVRPPQVVRTGVRYIQRITDADALTEIPELIRPEVLGAYAISDDDTHWNLCLTQAQAMFEEARLTARWGLIPPQTGVDPALPPIESPSWVMDIDVFDEQRGRFEPSKLTERVHQHSRRQYRFFRWAVEPAFLLKYGADAKQVAAVADGVTP